MGMLQGKPYTKKAFLKENPYEKAFFSTMLALKKALKGKKWEGVICFDKALFKGFLSFLFKEKDRGKRKNCTKKGPFIGIFL